MSLLVVGSVALDSVETPFDSAKDILGGSATYFSVVASFFSSVRVVAVVGEDFPREHIDFLETRDIDLQGLQQVPGKTFRWSGRYRKNLNERDTLETALNVFENFEPEIPGDYCDSPYLFLGNIAPELQLRVLEQVRSPELIACDTMNFWIERSPTDLSKVLEKIDILMINDEEARQLAEEYNLLKASRRIMSMGPKILIVKRGEYGAMMFHGDHIFQASAYPLEDVMDPTGAGDSFAGGFMGYLAMTGNHGIENLKRAMVCGTVAASFTVEDFSLDRLRTVTIDEIRARYSEFIGLTHFDELK
ncbi:PfkB family carbohydrate kinase [Thermodesulfobacteriota bacterium]